MKNDSLPSASVLIPSLGRPHMLTRCLEALGHQRHPPTEVLVVWQGEDVATRDAVEAVAKRLPVPVRALHSPEKGVVAAENVALAAASGEVVLLIDDDAIAPPDWVERHLAHYRDASVGAVGGPAVNHTPEGTPFPEHAVEPVGQLTWYGRLRGNMYDHPASWRSRPPREVDHLVGYNFSLRRSAFARFESALRPYWQMFELEACLQVKARGYRVLFDFQNVVEHHPTNTAYTGGREGNLDIKVHNSAFNHAFLLSKHSPRHLRPFRLLYLLLVGNSNVPGVLLYPLTARRFGQPLREARVVERVLRSHLRGWWEGQRARAGG